ncbi:MAG: AraC family transcriptional regulator [Gammaproteobacteria bacterium]
MHQKLLLTHGVKSLRVASSVLRARGIAVRECLRGTGIDEAALGDPDLRISVEQELSFYRNILDLTSDPLIGLEIGEQYRLPNYGIWGYAVMSAPTLRHALELAFRFIYLTYTCHDVRLDAAPSTACMKLEPLRDYEECLQVITDRDVAALFHLVGEMLGRRLPLEAVKLIHRGSRHRAAYERYFGCRVNFGHPCSELHLAPAVLDQALPHSDPHTARLTEYQCELLVARLNRHDSAGEQIKRHLLARPGHFPSLEAVARQMNRSARQLRRQLQMEGRSYTALVNELRYQLAREYLEETTLSIQEVATLLGYNEPSNFTHAFRQWSGKSPARHRSEHGGPRRA